MTFIQTAEGIICTTAAMGVLNFTPWIKYGQTHIQEGTAV
jgi:hypothetical protein